MSFNGNNITIGAMANPERNNSRPYNNIFSTISAYKEANVKHVISLAEVTKAFKKGLKSNKIKHYDMELEDFYPPTQKQMEKILNTVKKIAKKCEIVLIHCGEGFGRSGTILTGLYIKSDAGKNLKNSKSPNKLRLGIHDHYKWAKNIEPGVVEAINTIRNYDFMNTYLDKPRCNQFYSNSLKNSNCMNNSCHDLPGSKVPSYLHTDPADPPIVGCSVEKITQVEFLNKLFKTI